MRSEFPGRFAGLGRRPNCFAALLLCLLVGPIAFAQKSDESGKQPANLEKIVTTQETNDRIAQLTQTAAALQGDYPIGSGDLIGIEVFDVPELSRDARVDESGFVSLPLIPVKVRASGLTTFQFQDTITELLQTNGLVTNAQVTVTIKERHSEPITVIGAVKTPMVIQAVRQMTLLEVISQAGGVADNAGSTILITRPAPVPSPDSPTTDNNNPAPQATTLTIDLNDLLDAGDSKYNMPLVGGDVVRVPRAGVVYAVGAVQKPGGFVMESDRQGMTVLKLISLTGGMTPTGKGNEAILLRQNPATGKREQTAVDVKRIVTLKSEDVALNQGDILYVPDSASKRAWRRTGEIAIALATGVTLFRLSQGIP